MSMHYGTVAGIEKPISRIALGCGGFSLDRQEKANALLDAFVAAGGTVLDTAHVYSNGESERALGHWLQDRNARARVVIMTKGAHPNLTDWLPRLTPEAIAQDLRESLDRLQTDKIDLYLLHRDDPAQPVGPIVECLNEQVVQGKISAFGGSNWTHQRIAEANVYAAAQGLTGFTASSPHFALAVAVKFGLPGLVILSGNHAALDWYRSSQLPLFVWSSQAGGFFSDRFSPDNTENHGAIASYARPENWERARRAKLLAQKYGATPTQIALAWLFQIQLNLFAVIGPSTLPHLNDCLGALEISLTPEETAWVNLEELNYGNHDSTPPDCQN